MVKLNSLLSDRFRKAKPQLETRNETSLENVSLNELTHLSDFFKTSDLTTEEKGQIETILQSFKSETQDISSDFDELLSLTKEVKAINNQAIILHGERIKQAQIILKKYKDGAFSAWLVSTYGNRQTPYNFLQYYEFYKTLSPDLQNKVTEMPKQAIYTLASRDGEIEKKQEMIENYNGESKKEVLEKIRTIFPLAPKDKRQTKPSVTLLKSLERIIQQCNHSKLQLEENEKEEIKELLLQIEALL
ncbi:MAG: pGP6-D family virulence protein [Simkaniaceae bacterium]|nr:pGP6-D family virulence protein [Simkaniaceae bacterium]